MSTGNPFLDAAGIAPAPTTPAAMPLNNPGNLLPGFGSNGQPRIVYPGQTGVDRRGIAVFDTPQHGFQAEVSQLQKYQRDAGHPLTFRQIASIYAPRGHGANDPDAYAQRTASAFGMSPDDAIDLSDPATAQRLAQAHIAVEQGEPLSQPGTAAPASNPFLDAMKDDNPQGNAASAALSGQTGGLRPDTAIAGGGGVRPPLRMDPSQRGDAGGNPAAPGGNAPPAGMVGAPGLGDLPLVQGLSLHDLQDAGAGALRSASDLGSTLTRGLDWLSDKSGLDRILPNNNPVDWQARNEAAIDALAHDPNSAAFTGGRIAGGIAETAPLAGVETVGAIPMLARALTSSRAAQAAGESAPAITRLAAALGRYGDMAVQGGAAGALLSGGKDVSKEAAIGALLAPAAGKVIDSTMPRALAAISAAKNSRLAQALRARMASGAEDAAPAADAAIPAAAGAAPAASPADLPPLRPGASIRTGAELPPLHLVDAPPGAGARPEGVYANAPGEKPILHVNITGGADEVPTGPFGPIHSDVAGDWNATVQRLKEAQSGEVPGALSHPEIGPIDVPWGNEKAGLAHIIDKHPEVVDQLPEIVAQLPVKQTPAETGNGAYVLEDDVHRAVIAPDYQGDPKHWIITALEKKPRAPGRSDVSPGPSLPDGGSTGAGATATIAPNGSASNQALVDGLRAVSAKTMPPAELPPEDGAIRNARGSRGAQQGVASITDLPPEVVTTVNQLTGQGVPLDQALREASIRAIGGEPTLAAVTRNPEDQQAMWEGAKQATPEGRALAEQIARNNAALHDSTQEMIDSYGGIPAQGESVDAAARSLAQTSDAERRNVARLYQEAEAVEGDARVDPDEIYAVVNDPVKLAAVNPKAASFLKGIKGRLDLLTMRGKMGLNAHNLELLRRSANEAYDEVGSPEVRNRIRDVVGAIDDGFRQLGEVGPTYAKARAAHEGWAKKYEDPEGVRTLIRRTDRGEFVNAGNWRKLENGFVGGTADRPFVQIVNQLRATGDYQTLDRLKASVLQRAYERATNNATDKLGNSTMNGKMFFGQLDRIGMTKLKALFDPSELARITTIGHAATALNEAVPGTVNTSNTSSALLRAFGALKEPPKSGILGKLAKTGAHLAAGAVAPGAGNLVVEAGAHSIAAARGAGRAAVNSRELAEGLRRAASPTADRAAAKAEADRLADVLRRRAASQAISSHAAPVAGTAQEGRR